MPPFTACAADLLTLAPLAGHCSHQQRRRRTHLPGLPCWVASGCSWSQCCAAPPQVHVHGSQLQHFYQQQQPQTPPGKPVRSSTAAPLTHAMPSLRPSDRRLRAVRRPVQAAAGAGCGAGQGQAVSRMAALCAGMRNTSALVAGCPRREALRWAPGAHPLLQPVWLQAHPCCTSIIAPHSQARCIICARALPGVHSLVLIYNPVNAPTPACAWQPGDRGRHCGTPATAASWCRQTGQQSAGRPTSL